MDFYKQILKKFLDFTKNLNLKIIGSFIFDNLHIESEQQRIKKTISKSCALLEKINSKVFGCYRSYNKRADGNIWKPKTFCKP